MPITPRAVFFEIIFFLYALFASLVAYLVAKLYGRGPFMLKIGHWWVAGVAFIEKHVLGLTYKIEGAEYMPTGTALIAMQHQCAWETMKLAYIFKDPAIVLKEELLKLPLWGAAMASYGAIAVSRSRKIDDLNRTRESAAQMAKAGRPIVIFPQGTRTAIGEVKKLQRGVAALYEDLQIPIIPVTHNAGAFWCDKFGQKKSGVITLTFHPPIPAGLSRKDVMEKLESYY